MIQLATDTPFAKFSFTPAQELQARLLSPETVASFKHMATEFAEILMLTKFSTVPTERDSQMLDFVYRQAQYELLQYLVNESSGAMATLQASDPL